MKQSQQVALVGAGKFTDSLVARVPNLADLLGPVKGASLRVASRISNSLRAGHPVADYSGFEKCTLILLCVPDAMLGAMVAEMAGAPLSWAEKAIVVCSNSAGCDQLAPLAKLGAATGSLALIPGYEDRWFLLEGDRKVQKQARAFLVHSGFRMTVIEPRRKAHFREALQSIGTELPPCLKRASEELKLAGVEPNETTAIVEKQVLRTMRSFFRSGKIS